MNRTEEQLGVGIIELTPVRRVGACPQKRNDRCICCRSDRPPSGYMRSDRDREGDTEEYR